MISESISKENDDDVVAKTTPRTYTKLDLSIFKQFNDFLKIKYNGNEEIINQNTENEYDNIVKLGLIQARLSLASFTSYLLHKERKPRKDVWKNLGRIAKEILDNYDPKIHSSELSIILNKALGDRDPRVIEDYKQTITNYSTNNEFGETDTSLFLSLIPKEYLTTSSTSSSFEKEMKID